ncbi:hypothetical protein [Shinella sp.]|uniref:hypothetical protein n=1 Tax=Shinella sp. TaxID=1870904 RepID=UPI004036D810
MVRTLARAFTGLVVWGFVINCIPLLGLFVATGFPPLFAAALQFACVDGAQGDWLHSFLYQKNQLCDGITEH